MHEDVGVRKYPVKLFLIFMVSICSVAAEASDYNIKRYSEDPVISSAYIYSLSRDSLGYLWIGTAEGLIRFNGKTFAKFTTEDSLADNFISASCIDGSYMWFGHMNGSVSLFHRSRFEKVKSNTAETGPVTAFAKDLKGQTWMSTYDGKIKRLNRDKGIVEEKKFASGEAILSFLFLNEDRLLIGSPSGLFLCRITESEEIEIIRKIPETGNSQIVKIIRNSNENVYYVATSNDGIFILNDEITLKKIVTGAPDVQSICVDRFNMLWIATFTNGLYTYNTGNQTLTLLKEFEGENIRTIFEGNDGNIWIGGYGSGLTRVQNKLFKLLRFPDGKYGNNIAAICHDRQNAWIATEKGLVKSDLNGKIIHFTDLQTGKITALCKDKIGNLWIGTETAGIFILDPTNHAEKLMLGNGLLEQSVTSIAALANYMWIGTKKGLCRIDMTNHDIKWYTISNGLPHNSINGLYSDARDRIWISSHSNTLAYIKNDKIERFNIRSGSSGTSFSDFAIDHGSFLWAGSMGNGLYRITEDSIIKLSTQNGLYSDFCHSLIPDSSNHIWTIHKDGISRVNTDNFFVRSFDKFGNDGEKPNFNSHSASIDEAGKIWIGTENGILIIDQSRDAVGIPPMPQILSIRINNREYNVSDEKIILKHGKYSIEIEYAAVSQKEPDMIMYTIFLDRYDRQPELTSQNFVEYQNLTEGNYTFMVSAINGDGVSSVAGDKIEILIRTPVYKKWWFYLILMVILAGLVIGYIKRNQFIYKQEKRQLEEKVLERTREIKAQKDEIEKQRDLIHTKNAEITSSIRYAHEIQTALLPTEAKLDRYFPENFIFQRPKDIVSGDFYWLARKNDRIIFSVADCTGHGVPGAFMSMLSISILNEIVNVEGITETDKIVNRLHTLIKKSLNRSRADGLDMAICSYDWTNRIIQYTGAMNHLIHFRNGEMNVIKADQYSVNMITDDTVTFSMHKLDMQKGDIIYLFSDGYMDQFGGERDKKYSSRRFYQTLCEIHSLPMYEQELILGHKHDSWKKDRVQTDDITILGIRF